MINLRISKSIEETKINLSNEDDEMKVFGNFDRK